MDRTEPKLITFVMATDLSQRLRLALEISAVAAVIMILTAIAAGSYQSYIARTQVAEGLSLISAPKIDMVEYRASHGSWPAPVDRTSKVEDDSPRLYGKYVETIERGANGAINIVFAEDEYTSPALHNRTLTFRLATVAANPGGPVVLTCGDGPLPPGFETRAADRTTIAAIDLPAFCRKR